MKPTIIQYKFTSKLAKILPDNICPLCKVTLSVDFLNHFYMLNHDDCPINFNCKYNPHGPALRSWPAYEKIYFTLNKSNSSWYSISIDFIKLITRISICDDLGYMDEELIIINHMVSFNFQLSALEEKVKFLLTLQ